MPLLTIVYIVTPIASIFIVLLLIRRAKLSEELRRKEEDAQRIMRSLNSGMISDESLKLSVFKEISRVLESKQRCQEVTKKVSDLFDQELDRRIKQNTKETSKKYEDILEKNSKNEEIARNKYNRVLSEKKQADAVIHSIADGLLVLDAQGKVVMMNPALEKILGVNKKDQIGKPADESLKEEQLASLVKHSKGKEGKEIELLSQNNEASKTIRASSAVIEPLQIGEQTNQTNLYI